MRDAPAFLGGPGQRGDQPDKDRVQVTGSVCRKGHNVDALRSNPAGIIILIARLIEIAHEMRQEDEGDEEGDDAECDEEGEVGGKGDRLVAYELKGPGDSVKASQADWYAKALRNGLDAKASAIVEWSFAG